MTEFFSSLGVVLAILMFIILIVIPILGLASFLIVKLGTFGFLRGRKQFQEKEREEEQDGEEKETQD